MSQNLEQCLIVFIERNGCNYASALEQEGEVPKSLLPS